MCAPFSPRMRTLFLFTFAQEVDEVAVSSDAAKLEGFISLVGSRTKESTPFAWSRVRN